MGRDVCDFMSIRFYLHPRGQLPTITLIPLPITFEIDTTIIFYSLHLSSLSIDPSS